jgi:hypothetical protein
VEEELHDQGAAGRKLRFELVDLVIGALPLGLGAEALDPLDKDAAVPAAVEDRDLAGAGQSFPEAPEIVMGLFLRAWCGDRPDLEAARIDLGGDALDRPALPRRVPALAKDDRAAAVNMICDREMGEPFCRAARSLS